MNSTAKTFTIGTLIVSLGITIGIGVLIYLSTKKLWFSIVSTLVAPPYP